MVDWELELLAMRNEITPYLYGPLTTSNLIVILADIRVASKKRLGEIGDSQANEILNEIMAQLPPSAMHARSISTKSVIICMALDVLVDEYFVTMQQLPELQNVLWRELEADGISADIFRLISKFIRKKIVGRL
jgi:hypothetical protein